MISAIRYRIGKAMVIVGLKVMPAGTRTMLRMILLYHVPGALTEEEKCAVRASKALWQQERAP